MKNHPTTHPLNALSAALAFVLVAGCALFGPGSARHQTSSVVEYLYPGDPQHTDTPGVPTLALPLRVGIAFVPAESSRTRGNYFLPPADLQFSEKAKMALAKEISDQFREMPFVKSIELIPSAYLVPKGGFANLDQIRSMMGVDVIALLSYDQAQFTDEGLWSLTYWTVVGAYAVRGEKNDTKTMMDAAVYDIASRRLLFRAPGTSQVKGSAAPVNLSEKLRRDSELGLQLAATNLVVNLQEQLGLFQQRVKDAPEEFKIVKRPGYTGGASLEPFHVLLLAGAGGLFVWLRWSGRA